MNRTTLRKRARLLTFQRPIAGLLVQHGWDLFERVRLNYYCFQNCRGRGSNIAPLDPELLYRIRADCVTYHIGNSFDFISDVGRVVEGDWDQNATRFEKRLLHQAFVRHFRDDVPWNELTYYQQTRMSIERGEHSRYPSMKYFEYVLDQYDIIFESISSDGYQKQSDLKETSGYVSRLSSVTVDSNIIHEAAASIGRDGRLYLNDGRHRVSIARILDETVVLRIVVRHTDWQQLRNKIVLFIETIEDSDPSLNEVRSRVESEFEARLKDIFQGLDHPDLAVIFDRRFSNT